ncbi:hypothetical protein AgCh_004201 [Apium graveolens]
MQRRAKITQSQEKIVKNWVYTVSCGFEEPEEFKKYSNNGKNARSKVEFVSRRGAKPFKKRRQKKLKKARIELAPEFELIEEPASPRARREFHEKREVILMANARFPRKGRINFHPQDTLPELLGPQDALQVIKKQIMSRSQSVVDVQVPVPDEIYKIMSEILDGVWQMVLSLPTREVKHSVLEEEVRKLAYVALPDPSQQSLHNHYVPTLSGLLGPILKNNDNIIVEDTVMIERVVNNNANNGNEDTVMAERVVNNSANNGNEVPGGN